MTTQSTSLSAIHTGEEAPARGYERIAVAFQRRNEMNFSLVAENYEAAWIPPNPTRELLPCLGHLPEGGLAFHELLSYPALSFPTQTHTSTAMTMCPIANQPSQR